MRERLAAARSTGKRGIVYFITSDKTIQAVTTAGAFAILQYWAIVVAEAFNALPVVPRFPRSVIVLVLMHVIFIVAFWADRNTDEWRDMVEEKTGEAAADDEES